MLTVEKVTKSLGRRLVLDAVELTYAEAGVLVVRGENGAGKSTLLRIIAGIVDADEGDVRIAGRSLRKERVAALSALGYVAESPDLPPEMTVAELAALVAGLKACAVPSDDLADRIGATPIREQRFGTLSLGQRRRACLFAALAGDPPLLAMDEPTNGLDVDGVAMLVELLRERSRSGKAAVIASHDGPFIEAVASEVRVLSDGKLAAA